MAIEEKRIYKRYKSQSECFIDLGPTTYRGTILDYSVSGICAITKNDNKFVQGVQAHIKIPDLKMDFDCEVVWVKALGKDLKVGLKRIDGIKGSLKHLALSDILIGL